MINYNSFLPMNEVAALVKGFGDIRTPIVQGENGVGKTAILHSFKSDPYFANHIIIDPIDCTQLSDGSIWMPDIDREMGVSRELPNERLGVSRTNQKGVNGSRPVVICLDELAKAKQFIKDILAPIVYERRVGGYYLPEGSVVFACTNLSVEGLGDSIQAHLRNRLVQLHMRKPTVKEWVQNFAIPKGLSPELIAACDQHPKVFDSFMDYEPGCGGKYSGKSMNDNPYIFNPRASQDAYVTPRSLHAASDLIKRKDRYSDIGLDAALTGTLGGAFAKDLGAFIRFGNEIPEYSRVIADPAKCPIAKNPTAQIVQVFQFVTNVDGQEEAEAIVEYVHRMRGEMQGLFVNSVANSTRLGAFAKVKEFGAMLKEQSQNFSQA